MPYYKPQVITKRQAKKQINIIGIALIIYMIANLAVWYLSYYFIDFKPEIFMGYDPDLVCMLVDMITNAFLAAIVFGITASRLRLDLRDYMHSPRIRFGKRVALICMGIGLSLVVTAIPTIFYFMVHSSPSYYTFIGVFTTKNNILKNIVYFILMVLVEPICDEIIFRGIVQRQFGHYNRFLGVFISAILYAITRTSITEALSSLFVGIYLAAITLRYHSIKPAVTVHIFIALFSWMLNVMPQTLILIPTTLIVIIYAITGIAIFTRTIDFSTIHSLGPLRLWKMTFTSPAIILSLLLFVVAIVLSFTI